jgi:Protein of unknown function (DUF1501)
VWTRRQMLQRAGLGFGSLAVADLLSRDAVAANPLAPRPPHFPARAKAVIYLFMHGGPSQVDTFDPKPALARRDGQAPPAEYHELRLQFTDVRNQKLMASRQKFTRSGRAGIPISDSMPRLQHVADELCVLRGMHHEIFNHTPGIWLMNTGHDRMGRPSLGSWVTYGLGSESESLPAFVVMNDGPLKPGPGVWGSGFLPAVHQGTNLRPGSTPIPDLRRPTGLDTDAQRQILDYAQSLNRAHHEARPDDRELDARIAGYELAYRMQSAAPEAVDLARETEATRRLYGPRFGEQCLIARRLVERGVRFVQIYQGCGGGGWDSHGNNDNQQTERMREIDQGAAALLTDLRHRGLLDSTLVIWGGEFGRTPTTEGGSGRDHSPYGFSMWLAGGGVRGGMIHGATDDFGFRAVDGKVHAHDLNATILHQLGLDHERLTYRYAGRDFRLTDVYGNVVREILS